MSGELIEASSAGNYELVNKLILEGANVNYKWQNEVTPLIEAAKNGNIAVIQLLLQANANVHATDNNGMNALMHASFLKNTDAVLLLLDTSIDINARDDDNNSAVINCFIERYEQIYEEDFNKESISKNESSLMDISSTKYPFQRSLHYKMVLNTEVNIDILKALLEKGADINITDADKKTALIHATEHGNLEVIKIILRHNPNVNHVDGHRSNALSYASRLNNTEIAIELINAGIDINFKDEFESTALTYANMLANEELIKTLLSKGADLNTDLQKLTNVKIQEMIAAAEYVDFLLNNSLETFDNPSELDSSVLAARYKYLLNKLEIDFEDLDIKLKELNSCLLNKEDKNQLHVIFENLIFKNNDNLEDEAEFSSGGKDNFGDSSLSNSIDIETTGNVSISDFLDSNEDKNIFDSAICNI